ncbi:MAG: S1C family serine protease [Streptosporangiaceae bacterium]
MPPMPPPPRRRAGFLSYLVVAVVAGALGAGSVVALYHPASDNSAAAAPQPTTIPTAPTPMPSTAIPQPSSGGAAGSASQTAILNKVEPGLVIINTTLQYNSEQAAGTGMVINSDGLVLTNNHVIEDSTSITATDLGNGHRYTAKIIGYDVTGDVSLIQLQNASGLRTIPIGDSAAVKTGASVLAMGNAEGQGAIVPAAGSVTGLDQTINATDSGGTITSETLHGMIQTDANVVSGDSGGPLADAAGQVIGMDTAGSGGNFPNQQSSEGYAIPIDTALSIARQIAAGQASSTIVLGYPAFMGIYIAPGTSSASPTQQAQQEEGNGNGGFGGGFGGAGGTPSCYTDDSGLTAPEQIANVSSGTLIIGVICGSPAQSIGLTGGSVITAVNGHAVGAPSSLTQIVSKYRPGQSIQVSWVTPDNQRETRNLALISGPPL